MDFSFIINTNILLAQSQFQQLAKANICINRSIFLIHINMKMKDISLYFTFAWKENVLTIRLVHCFCTMYTYWLIRSILVEDLLLKQNLRISDIFEKVFLLWKYVYKILSKKCPQRNIFRTAEKKMKFIFNCYSVTITNFKSFMHQMKKYCK